MVAEAPVQARVVRLEVAREPCFEARTQGLIVDVMIVLDAIHDVPDLIKQSFVVPLVRLQFVVGGLAHEFGRGQSCTGQPHPFRGCVRTESVRPDHHAHERNEDIRLAVANQCSTSFKSG